MTQTGEVIRWDAERGFGFIATADGRRHVFFHVRDFRGGAAPGVGLRVGFEEIQVGGKGPRAMDVRPLNPAVTAASPRAATRSPGAPRP
ncbi:MAG: cold shock domain-containing protein, partial [Burkholderiales bacterium]|nr:cold shock domain-containing protein [Burkholderiales bacterium]